MRALLREPLLHFLLLGFGLFLLYGWKGGPAVGEGSRIVITAGRVEQLAAGYARMHQCAPDAGELEALVDDAIREEVYVREARALGLDRDDTIVRRRLRQKLEFVSEDVAPVAPPTEAQLQSFLDAHQANYAPEVRYEFGQVYLDPQRRGPALEADARALMTELGRAGALKPAALGDSLQLPQRFVDVSAREVARVFGAGFEAALRALPTGTWQGPVASGYGAHLVLIDRRDGGGIAALDAMRDAVRRDWLQDQRAQSNARFYRDLRKRYAVKVERTGAAGETIEPNGTPQR